MYAREHARVGRVSQLSSASPHHRGARKDAQNDSRVTPMLAAAFFGHAPVVEALLKWCATTAHESLSAGCRRPCVGRHGAFLHPSLSLISAVMAIFEEASLAAPKLPDAASLC